MGHADTLGLQGVGTQDSSFHLSSRRVVQGQTAQALRGHGMAAGGDEAESRTEEDAPNDLLLVPVHRRRRFSLRAAIVPPQPAGFSTPWHCGDMGETRRAGPAAAAQRTGAALKVAPAAASPGRRSSSPDRPQRH